MANIKTLSLKSFLILSLTVLYLESCMRPNLSSNKETNTASESVDTSIIAIIPYNTDENLGFENSKPAVITNEDIQAIGRILTKCIADDNAMQEKRFAKDSIEHPQDKLDKMDFVIDLKKYKRQYVAVVNSKGEKEVWVNCFCFTSYNSWKKQIIFVQDGGHCYFDLKINLATGRCYDFMVNGVA